MGTVNVVIAPATSVAFGPRVYEQSFRSAENVTTSGTSAASTGTAKSGDIARITAIAGACYVGTAGAAAVNAAGWYLAEGMTLDLGMREGDAVAVIEAS